MNTSFFVGRLEVESGEAAVGKGKRHAETVILALVALVKIQPNAQTLQVRVRMRRQHKQKRLNKVLQ